MAICRYSIVTNVRNFEVTSDGIPTTFSNSRCGSGGYLAFGWTGRNELEIVFGAYTNYCLFAGETITSVTVIECESTKHDCLNGACIPKTTYNTPGLYNSLAECEIACGTGCSGVCISNSDLATIEGLANQLKNKNCS